MEEKKIISGRFIQGEKVTVLIDQKQIKRKVYFSAEAGDLYIYYRGKKYFYYEFSWKIFEKPIDKKINTCYHNNVKKHNFK